MPVTPITDPAVLRTCQRAALDPDLFAHRLGPDLEATADRLGCDVGIVAHLMLCPMPETVEDVQRIAARFGVSAVLLVGA